MELFWAGLGSGFLTGIAVTLAFAVYMEARDRARSKVPPKAEFTRRTFQEQQSLKQDFNRRKRRARVTTAHMSQPRPWWKN